MRLRRKIPTFVFGVSIGLLVGVAFFVFKVNEVFERLRSSASERITVIEQPVKTVPVEVEKKKQDRERFKINLNKRSKVNYKEVDSLIAEDSRINVATEELLSVKNVKLIRIGDNVAETDSLASKLAQVNESPENTDLYFIEFWKTPLNTKGYKFTRNKILLYGFLDFNNVLLYQVDNFFYLKSSDQVYKLQYGGEFRKLERVVDTELLARLS